MGVTHLRERKVLQRDVYILEREVYVDIDVNTLDSVNTLE
jgi:hypothetical protein